MLKGRTTAGFCALAFLAGILIIQYAPVLPAPAWMSAVIALAVLWRWPRVGGTLWCVAAGAAWTTLRATLILAHGVPPPLEAKDVWVTGTVASIPTPGVHAVMFDFDASTLRRGTTVYGSPGRIRLGLYGDRWHPRVGERWRLRVRLKRPHGFQNPG